MTSTSVNKGEAEVSKRSGELSRRTSEAKEKYEQLLKIHQLLLTEFGDNWNRQSMVTMTVSSLSRLLYLNDVYQKIIEVPGVICEFGVHWGTSLTQLINLRSIYEPFNISRVVYGFDTFEGFVDVHDKDGGFPKVGDYASQEGFESTLNQILALLESFPPHSHLKKYELVKGDATKTIDKWLEDNPHAIISMAIFDMDLYEPTEQVLRKILPRLVKGSLLVFDELNHRHFPGETRALDEVIGLNNLRLHRNALHPHGAWAVWGE